jgi:hypothetical protein
MILQDMIFTQISYLRTKRVRKSEIMFITNKKSIQIPEYILIGSQQVKVANEFKLLGIIIDNKLNFIKNTCKIRKVIIRDFIQFKN